MKGKIKKALALIKDGNFKQLFVKLGHPWSRGLYRLRARWEDWRLGRVSINKTRPSKYPDAGAYAVQSTDYRCLDAIFHCCPLDSGARFVNVGCGEGRVLTYLYLRGFRGSLTGIELDPDVAATAAKRTKTCSNIRILCANILDSADTVAQANVFYLFNPFREDILLQFIAMIEAHCAHPVVLYYSFDLHRHVLDERKHWQILHRDTVRRNGNKQYPFTVYRFTP